MNPEPGSSSTIRHCRAGAGASAGTCALCLIGPSPACIRRRGNVRASAALKPAQGAIGPLTPVRRCLKQKKPSNLCLQLGRRQASFRAKEKPKDQLKTKFIWFSADSSAFRCALCAQPGQRSWPARKRFFASSLYLRKVACLISYAISAAGGDEPPMTACGRSTNDRLWRIFHLC